MMATMLVALVYSDPTFTLRMHSCMCAEQYPIDFFEFIRFSIQNDSQSSITQVC
eukprot:m.49381 g.49381  ORF g.49381 m.49381 type:complete len:54 (-) comp47934_c0_seq1:45-206(-)